MRTIFPPIDRLSETCKTIQRSVGGPRMLQDVFCSDEYNLESNLSLTDIAHTTSFEQHDSKPIAIKKRFGCKTRNGLALIGGINYGTSILCPHLHKEWLQAQLLLLVGIKYRTDLFWREVFNSFCQLSHIIDDDHRMGTHL